MGLILVDLDDEVEKGVDANARSPWKSGNIRKFVNYCIKYCLDTPGALDGWRNR